MGTAANAPAAPAGTSATVGPGPGAAAEGPASVGSDDGATSSGNVAPGVSASVTAGQGNTSTNAGAGGGGGATSGGGTTGGGAGSGASGGVSGGGGGTSAGGAGTGGNAGGTAGGGHGGQSVSPSLSAALDALWGAQHSSQTTNPLTAYGLGQASQISVAPAMNALAALANNQATQTPSPTISQLAQMLGTSNAFGPSPGAQAAAQQANINAQLAGISAALGGLGQGDPGPGNAPRQVAVGTPTVSLNQPGSTSPGTQVGIGPNGEVSTDTIGGDSVTLGNMPSPDVFSVGQTGFGPTGQETSAPNTGVNTNPFGYGMGPAPATGVDFGPTIGTANQISTNLEGTPALGGGPGNSSESPTGTPASPATAPPAVTHIAQQLANQVAPNAPPAVKKAIVRAAIQALMRAQPTYHYAPTTGNARGPATAVYGQ